MRCSALASASHDHGHGRPQQQRAQMIGLAQVADRAPGAARMRDQVAIGPIGRRRPARCRPRMLSSPGRPASPSKTRRTRGSRARCDAPPLRTARARPSRRRACRRSTTPAPKADRSTAACQRGSRSARRKRRADAVRPALHCGAGLRSTSDNEHGHSAPANQRDRLIQQGGRRWDVVGQQRGDGGGKARRCDQPGGRYLASSIGGKVNQWSSRRQAARAARLSSQGGPANAISERR